ncbi:restriction endonuclease [Rhizobium leguminosarum]|uniref:restriction endonuclease n=1 Tax=Rhizobium leguminosarum TaxID=384 RepID=UPI00144139E9|nr:restriction endonuclease [Rhizobium leguminosarum]NKL98448.1 hypothetical protein [Rhizobium leguminosarum bv. viciae]
MTIWEYGATSRDDIWSIDCLFCRSPMTTVFSKHHDTRKLFNRHTGAFLSNHTDGVRIVQRCELCGWWKAYDHSDHETTRPLQTRQTLMGAAGSLKELDLQDIGLPLDEVRNFLLARYDSRFDIHPRLFEETVASGFQSLGFNSIVTAYSGDGGIDGVLEKDGRQIGVQVKRYRGSIEVEQIRAFVGSLVLKDMTEGIFVTTSCFQSGGQSTAALAGVRGYRIDLVDAPRFYDALKLGQLPAVGEIDQDAAFDYFRNLRLISDQLISFE